MENLSFLEKISKFFGMIFSSPFFLFILLSVIATIILLVLSKKEIISTEYLRKILMYLYTFLGVIIVIKYIDSFLLVSDAFVEKLFTAIYFPNIISYICMMIASLLIMLYSILKKGISRRFKIINLIAFLLISLFSILVIDVIATGNVDIHEKASLYANTNITIFIQASMIIFTIWMFILLVSFIVNLINKKNFKKNEI